jgi:hypothetical protein
MTDLKLGRKPGVVVDRRTVTLDQLLDLTVISAPPVRFDVATSLRAFPMFANDLFGDCTCAAQGHRVVAEERSASQHEVQLTDDDVLAVYSAVAGFRRNDPSTDNGAYCLDVLNYMRHVGMGKERDGTPHTIGAFAALSRADHLQVKIATRVFGGLYVGAGLPTSAQGETHSGRTWSLTRDVPGSWGGHALYVRGYDVATVHFVTWGREQKATWAWWDRYVDEGYAVISEDYVRGSGRTPQGLDIDYLNRFLASLRR